MNANTAADRDGHRPRLDGNVHVAPAHSSVEFEVKHMMIATVRGRFRDSEGTIEAAEDIAHSRVSGVVRTGSIDTNEPTATPISDRPTSSTRNGIRRVSRRGIEYCAASDAVSVLG